jgi:hypothetical protein
LDLAIFYVAPRRRVERRAGETCLQGSDAGSERLADGTGVQIDAPSMRPLVHRLLPVGVAPTAGARRNWVTAVAALRAVGREPRLRIAACFGLVGGRALAPAFARTAIRPSRRLTGRRRASVRSSTEGRGRPAVRHLPC